MSALQSRGLLKIHGQMLGPTRRREPQHEAIVSTATKRWWNVALYNVFSHGVIVSPTLNGGWSPAQQSLELPIGLALRTANFPVAPDAWCPLAVQRGHS